MGCPGLVGDRVDAWRSERLEFLYRQQPLVELLLELALKWQVSGFFVQRGRELTFSGRRHAKKISSPETWIERIAEGWHELGDKRAVVLVQLPPTLRRDDARLHYFLERVPDWMRIAVELRHPSWEAEEVFELLGSHRAAYCVMSGADLSCILRATADFVYVRLHGPHHDHLYRGYYSDQDLQWWADRIREWDLRDGTCWPTSTTTARATPCATPSR